MLVRCLIALSALTLCAPALAQDQLFKLNAADGAAGDNFGLRVSIVDGLIAVGAWVDDVPGAGSDAGSAYLYSASTGQQLQHLVANDAAADDWFGISVSAAGTRALIGSCNDDDFGSDSGSAYIYNTLNGAELFKLNASNPSVGALYGARVDHDGNTGVIGAPLGNGIVTGSGSAYVIDMTTGLETAKLQANDGANDDWFGLALAISGERAIVGSFFDDPLGQDSGSAYMFNTTTGQQLFKLTAFDGGSNHNFGARVAIDGNTALVGAWTANGAFTGTGAAYVYEVTSGAFQLKLTASDGVQGDNFGASVALSGHLAVVGATGANGGSGAVYVFDLNTGQELYKLIPSDLGPADEFGAVAIDGDFTVAASRLDDDLGPDSGSAYLFSTPQGPAVSYCFGDDSGNSCPCGNPGGFGDGCGNSSGAGARLLASGSASVASDDLAFDAQELLASQPALLFVGNNQVQLGNGALFGDGLRCAGGGVKRLGVQVPGLNGDAAWPSGLGLAGAWSAGDTRRFQGWYRDPAGPCGAGFNLTNGLEVVFTP